jgi:tetratricopeptide (TPR) repeat protein
MTDDAGTPTTPDEPVTSTTRPLPRIESGDHQAALRLAHLHLRLGSLTLARAELETLAGRDALDEAGLVDLAEARWRTGDVAGAGEVAAVVLGDGDDGPLLALVVAAEAALLRGRPTEARRYAGKALAAAGSDVDAVFAGMPRGPVWPVDRLALSQPAPTLFDGPDHRRGGPSPGSTTVRPPDDHLGIVDGTTPDPSGAGPEGTLADGSADAEHPATPEPVSIALWASLEAEPPSAIEAPIGDADAPAYDAPPTEALLPEPVRPAGAAGDAELPLADESLARGRDALAAHDLDTAAAQLGLALRLAPDLAPEVLDVIDDRRDPRLAFVRGDAYRLVGREADARDAYADAVRPVPASDPPTDPPSEGDPA